MPPRALVFIGFMGAGKSTAAAEVAAALGVQALDGDRLLEEQLGHSVAREFELHGEEGFRAQERAVVRGLLDRVARGDFTEGPLAIALGGGAVLSAEVRAALAPHTVVLLDVSPQLAWERVQAQATAAGGHSRPLAREWEAFAELHAQRQPLYEELADAILPAAVPGVAVHALAALCALAETRGAGEREGEAHGGGGARRGTRGDAGAGVHGGDRGIDGGDAPGGDGGGSGDGGDGDGDGAQGGGGGSAGARGRARLLWAAAASGEYPVLVGRGLLHPDAPPAVWRLGAGGEDARDFCVSDEHVAALYTPPLRAPGPPIVLAPGEAHKTLASAEAVWRALAAAGMTRADRLVALGGGVVGDLAGFCAATYQRGVGVLQVPTTLVAQVDSAYGGKTGVDLPEAKNYVGAYHQPCAVIVDPDALHTLPAAELHAGWVEVLKTALIAGGRLWQRVGEGERDADERTILECARLKLAVVAQDERDAGARQVLNLGHTVGHAIETASGYARYRHGEAVGLGLLATLRLSGLDDLREHVRELLAARGLPVSLDPNEVAPEAVIDAVAHDKKRLAARVPFVLLDRPGRARSGCEVAPAALRTAVGELFAPAA
jgi:3-dehydroquinate synthetase/shikimate kinase